MSIQTTKHESDFKKYEDGIDSRIILTLVTAHFLLSHNADKCLQRQVNIQVMPKYLTRATGIDERGSNARVYRIAAKCDYR